MYKVSEIWKEWRICPSWCQHLCKKLLFNKYYWSHKIVIQYYYDKNSIENKSFLGYYTMWFGIWKSSVGGSHCLHISVVRSLHLLLKIWMLESFEYISCFFPVSLATILCFKFPLPNVLSLMESECLFRVSIAQGTILNYSCGQGLRIVWPKLGRYATNMWLRYSF